MIKKLVYSSIVSLGLMCSSVMASPAAWVVVDNQDSKELVSVPVISETHQPFYAEVKAVFHNAMAYRSPHSQDHVNINMIVDPTIYYHIYDISLAADGIWDVKVEVVFQGTTNPVEKAKWIIAGVGKTVFNHSGLERLHLNFGNLPDNSNIPSTTNWPYTEGSTIYQWAINNL